MDLIGGGGVGEEDLGQHSTGHGEAQYGNVGLCNVDVVETHGPGRHALFHRGRVRTNDLSVLYKDYPCPQPRLDLPLPFPASINRSIHLLQARPPTLIIKHNLPTHNSTALQ